MSCESYKLVQNNELLKLIMRYLSNRLVIYDLK